MRSSEAAAAEDSGAPGSSAEVPREVGSGGCDEEVGSRSQNAEGDVRAVVQVAPMPPAPAPNGSAAPEVRGESSSASAAPEVRAVSLAASAAPDVRAQSLAASAAPEGWLEKKWPQQIALIKLAGKGGWFQQFRVVALLRISPFPYTLFNYAATITQIKYTPYICGSVVGMVPDTLVNIYSGRLILTLADLKYDKRRMTTVEIVYNVISAVVAVLIGVGFTIYARKALDGIQSAEGARQPEPAAIPTGPVSELRGSHRSSSSVPVDVV
ncbi:hypothetical protein ACQ4PT_058303 [Festuca glaucescens]